jgi:RNA polymerase sigma-70 factor (ECF subfamily)
MSDTAPVPQDLLEHAAFLRRIARSLLLDAHAAEDLLQETWTRSLERPPTRGGDLRAWLARVARNFAYRRKRAEARRGERERDSARPEGLPSAEAALERGETLQRVVDAVRALEEPYRATILARFYEDLPARAIAARDGVPVETVNTRLKRGLARLRQTLARDRHEWREALGLLAGESPCLPPHAGGAATLTLAQVKILTALAAAPVLAWGLWRVLEPGKPRSEPAVASRAASAADAGAADPNALLSVSASASRQESFLTVRARELAGRVIDEQGVPVAGAEVCVLGHLDPFGPLDANPQMTWNHFHGRTFSTDAEGRWRAQLPAEVPLEQLDCRDCHAEAVTALPEPGKVFVALREGETYEPATEQGGERWVSVPANDVDFVVHRFPTGTVEIRVAEGAGHVPIEDFKVVLHGGYEPSPEGGVIYRHGYKSDRAQGSLLRSAWRVEDPAGVEVHVILLEPDVGSLWSRLMGRPDMLEQVIVLQPDEVEQVLFVIPERGVVRGIVVDELGAPVPDALVFFGEETRARGDEPFKPLRPERIRDGARTGADGWFELRGDGQRVTALHADHCANTFDVADAGRIVLRPLGAIRGRALDADGRPAAGALLYLGHPSDGPEDSSPVVTDAAGSFAFERVQAGVHALWRDTGSEQGELLLGIRLAPGAELEVELRLGSLLPLELEVPGLDPDERSALEGLLVGFDQTFSLCAIEDGQVEGAVLPGRYWFATRQGLAAPLTVNDGDTHARVELGDAPLIVRSSARQNVQVVPAGADPFLRLAAAGAWIRAVGDTEARFRLHPGGYLIVGEAGIVLREVELPSEGLELTLE